MITLFNALKIVIKVVAYIVFAASGVLTLLGIYDFVHAFSYLSLHGEKSVVGLVAVGLLKAVDMFLISIVLYVFAIGILILFTDKELPVKMPEWLRVKDFMQLKIILWEAILTTLVVSYLASLASANFKGIPLSEADLIIPGAILLIALSIYFLKKGEH